MSSLCSSCLRFFSYIVLVPELELAFDTAVTSHPEACTYVRPSGYTKHLTQTRLILIALFLIYFKCF